MQGKTPKQVAKERVEAENELYKKENYAGMSTEACSVKMYTQRQEELKDILSTSADFMPVVGTIKSVAEALTSGESWEAVKDTVNKAAKGNQKALENLADSAPVYLSPALNIPVIVLFENRPEKYLR
ncbi:TPA: hypothetical protein RG709_001400 [Proteus mirabilis]|uniref:Uncharacterized protein n=2 Tax=Morganellaceae TaxID=1903414 RepID=A0AAW7CW54_9GAMM|nr:hypothetical protein [Proteus faecis]EFC1623603.1 hypothetical protein [Escherichia coli]HBR0008016.1 hypothetical protein [Klebsiella aerogenes]HCR3550476.1 hypothetical protein [Morganella morganii]HDU8606187.1 hypothetical protein [Proteus mirabilis]MDL5168967.1 hypothetical protein [Proteus faecis]